MRNLRARLASLRLYSPLLASTRLYSLLFACVRRVTRATFRRPVSATYSRTDPPIVESSTLGPEFRSRFALVSPSFRSRFARNRE